MDSLAAHDMHGQCAGCLAMQAASRCSTAASEGQAQGTVCTCSRPATSATSSTSPVATWVEGALHDLGCRQRKSEGVPYRVNKDACGQHDSTAWCRRMEHAGTAWRHAMPGLESTALHLELMHSELAATDAQRQQRMETAGLCTGVHAAPHRPAALCMNSSPGQRSMLV